MTFRYIGSKTRVVEALAEHIGLPSASGSRFVDAFCGTGVVAEAAAKLGWSVWLNDHLVSAVIVAAARLISEQEAEFKSLGGYCQAIAAINALEPIEGYIWRQYSPASAEFIGIERRYFTEGNAAQIDAARAQIHAWKTVGALNDTEERLLVADLLSATNRVANIAGTYGCFLSRWTRQAAERFVLLPRELASRPIRVKMTMDDVSTLRVHPDDLVYLDPPYTKRQYASYYHILETIAVGDEPAVEGVSGLRPWRAKASDFCYRTRAMQALSDLIRDLNAKRILLSYSEEGHVPIDHLHHNLAHIGAVEIHVLRKVGRYRPNVVASAKHSWVREYLIEITKELEPCIEGSRMWQNECSQAI